jgi:predicted porin
MKYILTISGLVLLLAAMSAVSPAAAQIEESDLNFFNPYGSFRAHMAFSGRSAEIENNSSRLGLMMTSDTRSGWSLSARGEWGINLVKNETAFSLDDYDDIGWSTLKEGDPDQTIWTRLGYVGVEYERTGELSIGKRWSVYSDVASWTDMFDVFGGWASGQYPGGTDGGFTGTGRAEKVLMYRHTIKGVFIGAQMQMRGTGKRVVDSYGLASHVTVADGLSVGAAWNDAWVEDSIRVNIPGALDHARALVTGVKYEKDSFYIAGIYTWQDGNEAAHNEEHTVIYSCHGTELFIQGYVTETLWLHGGFNLRVTRDPHPTLPEEFGLRHYIVGAAWYLRPTTYIYSEFLLDDSIYGDGHGRDNLLTLGIWMDFASPRMKH